MRSPAESTSVPYRSAPEKGLALVRRRGGATHPAAAGAAGPISRVRAPEAKLRDFSGFFQPVDNPPVFNKVKAGQAIPVKFSLQGNHWF